MPPLVGGEEHRAAVGRELRVARPDVRIGQQFAALARGEVDQPQRVPRRVVIGRVVHAYADHRRAVARDRRGAVEDVGLVGEHPLRAVRDVDRDQLGPGEAGLVRDVPGGDDGGSVRGHRVGGLVERPARSGREIDGIVALGPGEQPHLVRAEVVVPEPHRRFGVQHGADLQLFPRGAPCLVHLGVGGAGQRLAGEHARAGGARDDDPADPAGTGQHPLGLTDRGAAATTRAARRQPPRGRTRTAASRRGGRPHPSRPCPTG